MKQAPFDPFDVQPVKRPAEPVDPFDGCDVNAEPSKLWSALATAALLAWLDGATWTTPVPCVRCGPVWSWPNPEGFVVTRCPWCDLREQGVDFPRPPAKLPAPRTPAPRGRKRAEPKPAFETMNAQRQGDLL